MEPRISIITLGVSNLEKSYKFYTALGFSTSKRPEDGIIFFKTGGVCLAIYPLDELAKDVSSDFGSNRSGFSGVTLAHNTKSKAEVDEVLELAMKAGGKIEKPAQDVFWGGMVAISLILMGIYGKLLMVTAGSSTRMEA